MYVNLVNRAEGFQTSDWHSLTTDHILACTMPQSPKTSDGLSWQLGMSALIPTIGKTRGTPVPIAVTQTARDALSAKLAALRECSDGGGDHSCFSGVETYRELLTRMAEAFGQHRQQQQETNRVDTTTALSSYQQTPLVRRGTLSVFEPF